MGCGNSKSSDTKYTTTPSPEEKQRPSSAGNQRKSNTQPSPKPSTPKDKKDKKAQPTEGNNIDAALERHTIVGNIDKTGRKTVSNARVILSKAYKITDFYDFDAKVLGTGMSGSVKSVTQKATGEKFALKKMNILNLTERKHDQLFNELDIFLRLDHPNIVRLNEVYEDDNYLYIVMEMCSGGELFDRLTSRKRYSEADAATLIKQMLQAINYCHQRSICHRDLKLENWMFADESDDSQLKLIDFGFSRIFKDGVPMTRVCGTCFYVAPEVLSGQHDNKCDIWSLGVIMYMLLSGMPPFYGKDEAAILKSVKTARFNFNPPVWQNVSKDAKDFITAALEKNPAKRPSASEILQHKWLVMPHSDTEPEIDVSVLMSIRNFAASSAMKRAALGLIAMTMSTSQVTELEKQFKALDTDGDGTISMEELSKQMKKHLNLSDEESARIFSHLDVTGNQEVHYSEFLAASFMMKLTLNEDIIRNAFKKLDVDGSGCISASNLRQVLGDSYKGAAVEELILQCDKDGDGQIQYEEFVDLLIEGGNHKEPSDAALSPQGSMILDMDRNKDPLANELSALNAYHHLADICDREAVEQHRDQVERTILTKDIL